MQEQREPEILSRTLKPLCFRHNEIMKYEEKGIRWHEGPGTKCNSSVATIAAMSAAPCATPQARAILRSLTRRTGRTSPKNLAQTPCNVRGTARGYTAAKMETVKIRSRGGVAWKDAMSL